jgi:hypothetical protein
VSGYVGLTSYGSCLIVGVDPTGIRLSILFPFRIGHPPLFLPWRALRIDPPSKWWWRTTLVVKAAQEGVTLRFGGKRVVNGLWEGARKWAPGSCTPDYANPQVPRGF